MSASKKLRLGITLGDCAGIGPEIVDLALKSGLLSESAGHKVIGKYPDCSLGKPTIETAHAAAAALEEAVTLARRGELDAVVVQGLRFPYANQFHDSSLVQRGDGFQRRSTTSSFPVGSQFLAMQGSLPEDGERLDLNKSLVFLIFGVEMRRAVISKVHPNHDPKKSGYLRHFFT